MFPSPQNYVIKFCNLISASKQIGIIFHLLICEIFRDIFYSWCQRKEKAAFLNFINCHCSKYDLQDNRRNIKNGWSGDKIVRRLKQTCIKPQPIWKYVACPFNSKFDINLRNLLISKHMLQNFGISVKIKQCSIL